MDSQKYITCVLGLQLPTDPRWVDIAAMNIREILIDHAYCEQKAASSCISLIVLFPDRTRLVEVLTPVVAEEWSHFERVMAELAKRGYAFGPSRMDAYVFQLQQLERKGGPIERQLMDKLLINALIEARSCERFKMLSIHLPDKQLQSFYHELMVSEAGHYRNFIELAETYRPVEEVQERWKTLLKAEADILKTLEPRGDRMH